MATDAYLIISEDISQAIEVQCSKCKSVTMDQHPAFWKTDSRFYVIRDKRTCQGCGNGRLNHKVYQIPVDDIPWTNGDIATLKRDRDSIIIEYNNWVANQKDPYLSYLRTTSEEQELKRTLEEEAWEETLEKWEQKKNWARDWYIDEKDEWYRDPSLTAIGLREKWLKKQNLGEWTWGDLLGDKCFE
ncbi:hypothetical protein EG329_002226 [Mollisiaceae sp. DMI_Dod_QoI]|nr:hypothetical protein EG329_002226 [Helotiales sp. DMI_Dod_QoI]